MNRPPKSAQEIAALPAPGTEREAHVRVHADAFTRETMVFLLRETAADGNTALFERCAIALVGHAGEGDAWVGGSCERIIRSVANATGFAGDPDALRDLRQQTLIGMFKAIHAGSAKKPFWEERFGRALKQLCIDEAQRLTRSLHELEWAEDREELTETTPGERLGKPGLEDDVWNRVVEQDLRAATLRLPPRQARAAFLVLIEKRPVGSAGPDSAMNIMGVSEREVYALLVKAKTALAADPQLRKYLENR